MKKVLVVPKRYAQPRRSGQPPLCKGACSYHRHDRGYDYFV